MAELAAGFALAAAFRDLLLDGQAAGRRWSPATSRWEATTE